MIHQAALTAGMALVCVALMGGSALLAARAARSTPPVATAVAGTGCVVAAALITAPQPTGWLLLVQLVGALLVGGAGVGAALPALLRAAGQRARRSDAVLPRWRSPVRAVVPAGRMVVHIDALGLLGNGLITAAFVDGMALLAAHRLLSVGALGASALTACVVVAAHESGHLVAGLRRGWAPERMWLGLANHVRFATDGIPVRTTSLIAVSAAGPLAGAAAGLVAAAAWLALTGPIEAVAALAIGPGMSCATQLIVGGDAVGVWGGLRALKRGARVVVLDPQTGIRAASATA